LAKEEAAFSIWCAHPIGLVDGVTSRGFKAENPERVSGRIAKSVINRGRLSCKQEWDSTLKEEQGW